VGIFRLQILRFWIKIFWQEKHSSTTFCLPEVYSFPAYAPVLGAQCDGFSRFLQMPALSVLCRTFLLIMALVDCWVRTFWCWPIYDARPRIRLYMSVHVYTCMYMSVHVWTCLHMFILCRTLVLLVLMVRAFYSWAIYAARPRTLALPRQTSAISPTTSTSSLKVGTFSSPNFLSSFTFLWLFSCFYFLLEKFCPKSKNVLFLGHLCHSKLDICNDKLTYFTATCRVRV